MDSNLRDLKAQTVTSENVLFPSAALTNGFVGLQNPLMLNDPPCLKASLVGYKSTKKNRNDKGKTKEKQRKNKGKIICTKSAQG